MRSLKGNLCIVVFIGFFQACIPGSSNGKEVQKESIESAHSILTERRAYYQREMAQKGFFFKKPVHVPIRMNLGIGVEDLWSLSKA